MNNHQLFELIAQLNTARNYDDIQKVCSTFCHHFGFNHFIYGARIPTSLINPTYIILSGYPDEWRNRYIEQDYLLIDPTVSHCMDKITPILWEQAINTSCKQDKVIDKLFYEADDYGLRSGISYPIHCIHGEAAMLSLTLSLTSDKSTSHIQHTFATGQLFASYVHEAVTRIPDNTMLAKANSRLTSREKECLLWTTEGKTSWEISQILNISERTVVFHLGNTAKKLNVTNKQHAVARAISLGYITPQY